MLRVDNVSVSYGDVPALTGVSLEVGKGEVVSLIGANGAGKTTLLETLAGLNIHGTVPFGFTGKTLSSLLTK